MRITFHKLRQYLLSSVFFLLFITNFITKEKCHPSIFLVFHRPPPSQEDVDIKIIYRCLSRQSNPTLLDAMSEDHNQARLHHDFLRHVTVVTWQHQHGLLARNTAAHVVIVDPPVILTRF